VRLRHVPQLDGLRGVAVAAVVVYHLEPDLLPGGFLGVDVFFVLSGFLIGSLLLAEAESSGRIDLRTFYVRRARRLMPASLLLLAAVVVYAATIAGAAELSRLRNHVLWTLGWVANWGYVSDGTSYIDLVAGSSPLRHTWSLAIEEQFYAVFPALVAVVVLRSRGHGPGRLRRTVGWSAALGFVASALAMVVLSAGGDELDRAYYGTDTRLQAILAGVVLASMVVGRPPTDDKAARFLRWPSLAAAGFLSALMWFGGERETWMYRGGFSAAALLSVLVIAGVFSSKLLSTALSARPVVGLGRISYGVYLWHWPIIVVADKSSTGLDGPALAGLRLSLTLACALVSWHLVEQPIRRGSLGLRLGRRAPALALASVAAVAVAATWATRTPSSASDGDERPAVSTTPGANPVRLLMAGDSVAHTLAGGEVYEFPDFRRWQPGDSPFDSDEVTLLAVTRPGCTFLAGSVVYETESGSGDVSFAEFCGDWKRDLGASVEDFRPEVVLVLLANDSMDRRLYGDLVRLGSAEWQKLLDEALDEFRRPTEEAGAVLVLLTPPARVGRYVRPEDEGGWREAKFADGLRSYAARRPGVAVLDLAGVVCPGNDCADPSTGFDPAWRYDGWHFGGAGPAWIAGWLTDRLAELLPSRVSGT